MKRFFQLLFLFLPHLIIFSKKINENQEIKLPECPFIHPIQEMERWDNFDWSSCNISQIIPTDNTSAEYDRFTFGQKSFSFNILVSDKIGPRRNLGNVAHQSCSKIEYNLKIKASVVIIYHNEGFSVLVRMINSILDRSPLKNVYEIIFYDDASENNLRINDALEKYAQLKKWKEKTKFLFVKNETRSGLIKAKVI